MPVQTYTVDVEYKGRDAGAQRQADRLGVSLNVLQGGLDRVSGGLDTAARSMERLALGAAALGTGAAIAGARSLVGQMIALNSSAQDSQVAIGGMLQANGATANWGQSMQVAQDAMAKIRLDAAALPGEAQDYINIFQASLAPAIQSGLAPLDAVNLADRFGAVTSMLGIDSEQAGSDLNRMLTGRAGAQVQSWRALQAQVGKTAEQFNALSITQRRVLLDGALGHYSDAIDAAGRSWGGILGTLKSDWENVVRTLGAPVFERMKASAQHLVDYLSAHGPEIDAMAQRWGNVLAHAFDVALERGRDAVGYLTTHWRELRDEIVQGAKRILHAYLAIRAASAGMGLVSGGISLARGAQSLGLFGGAASAAGVGAVGAETAAAGTAATAGVGAAGAETAAVAGGAAGGPIALAALVALGAIITPIVNGFYNLHGLLDLLGPSTHMMMDSFHELWTSLQPILNVVGTILIDALASLVVAVEAVVTVVNYVVAFVAALIDVIASNIPGAHQLIDALRLQHDPLARKDYGVPLNRAAQSDWDVEQANRLSADANGWHVRQGEAFPSHSLHRQDPARPPAPGGHTTIINHWKVEQADNPERLALGVQHILEREMRNPTQSAQPGTTRLSF